MNLWEVDALARIYTRQEVKRRRMKFQVFAGMFDFIGILAGLIVIVVCLVLLSTLYHWVIDEVATSFSSLWNFFMNAIIIPE